MAMRPHKDKLSTIMILVLHSIFFNRNVWVYEEKNKTGHTNTSLRYKQLKTILRDLDSFVSLIVHKLSTASSTVIQCFHVSITLNWRHLRKSNLPESTIRQLSQEGDVNVSIKQRWTKPRQQIKSSICSSLKVYTSILSLLLSVRV